MRLLAASDLHGNRALYRRLPAVAREHAVDAMVLAGDLLGSPEGYSSEEEAQRADASAIIDILSSHGGPIFYLMGNDDWIELGIDTSVFQSLHLKCLPLGGFTLVGYQCTLPFMGGIFERREDEIARTRPRADAAHRDGCPLGGPRHPRCRGVGREWERPRSFALAGILRDRSRRVRTPTGLFVGGCWLFVMI